MLDLNYVYVYPRVSGTRPLLSFAHLTDPQIVDEASPARVAFTDHFDDIWPGTNYLNWPTNSAYRPHEAFSAHMMDASVRAISKVHVGPTTGLPLSFTITTGDMADNNQFNETQWAIAIMDGRYVSTASGNWSNAASPTFSGIWKTSTHGGTDANFWHPNLFDGTYWLGQPQVEASWYSIYGFPNGFPDHTALQSTDLKATFKATGIGMDWYGSFGNHDVETQGNAPRNFLDSTLVKFSEWYSGLGWTSAQDWATGSKVITWVGGLPTDYNNFPGGVGAVWDLLSGSFPVDTFDTGDADGNRRFMSRADIVSEHWRFPGTPAGHGFAYPGTQGSDKGYYSFLPTSTDLFKFISLDSNNLDGFGASGWIDNDQAAWLENQLQAVSSRYYDVNGNLVTNPNVYDRLVVLYSHHTLDTMNKISTDVVYVPSIGGASSTGTDIQVPLGITGQQLEQLLLRYPNVVFYVDGHTHTNRIIPHSITRNTGSRNGFWEVTTASVIDWPCQSRIIDVSQKDGILYFDTTMVDVDAPLYNDGDQDISNDLPGSPPSPMALASVGRVLAANDPQENPNYYWAGDPLAGRRAGQVLDRNVQLSVPAPFATQMVAWGPTSITAKKNSTPGGTLIGAYHTVGATTFSATGLPPGLSIGTTSGAIPGLPAIVGTPTQMGNFTSTVTATDAAGTTARFTTAWTILSDLNSAQQTNISATQWDVESIPFKATGGTAPYTWSVSAPTGLGLTLNATTGVYSGTLKNYGTFTVYYTVTDATGTKDTKQFTVSVAKSSNL